MMTASGSGVTSDAPSTRSSKPEQEAQGQRVGTVKSHRDVVKLQEENLSNPRPGLLYKLWNSSHPTLGERIDFCNEYRPWEKGEPLRYEHLIRPAR